MNLLNFPAGRRGWLGSPSAVLVTGAGSGIGRKVTAHLADGGYVVYAGARSDADLESLEAIENVRPVRLDVTDTSQIEAAVATIKKSGRRLHAIVNNAGIATVGSVVETQDREIELVLDVNVLGPCRIIRAFAPLVMTGQGRIVIMGSTSGILAPANFSTYSMSKHAIEALADALADEMQPHGVSVSIVEPGGYNTGLARKALDRIGPDARMPDLSDCDEPDAVAEAVTEALSAATPKRRYLVVARQDQARRTIQKQLAQLAQLNEGHAHAFDRDSLVRMLDEALAGARNDRSPA